MKTYVLIGNNGYPNLSFCLGDLIPVSTARTRTYKELDALIDESDYQADRLAWNYSDLYRLFAKTEYHGVNPFEVHDAGVVVMSASYLYLTAWQETMLTQNVRS